MDSHKSQVTFSPVAYVFDKYIMVYVSYKWYMNQQCWNNAGKLRSGKLKRNLGASLGTSYRRDNPNPGLQSVSTSPVSRHCNVVCPGSNQSLHGIQLQTNDVMREGPSCVKRSNKYSFLPGTSLFRTKEFKTRVQPSWHSQQNIINTNGGFRNEQC